MKQEWLAVVERNLTSMVFSTSAFSDDVLYWIKRFGNGNYHTAVSTDNTYELRSFEFYDKNLTPCIITYGRINKWKCLKIKETSLDRTGSHCLITIADPKDQIQEIRMFGLNSEYHGGFRMAINENFYFTAIILFLNLLSKYIDWEHLEKRDFNLFNDIKNHSGVPLYIFDETEKINSSVGSNYIGFDTVK